jgi:uroporphyrin-III C-methyltransferase/precorrin-2 dehydrogenase/sirohydrochlorin ferrochelatase
MDQLPVFLNVQGRSVAIIGSGDAADAKRRLVEAAGAVVTDDAAAALIAFVADDDAARASAIAQQLRQRGLLVNVVDRPALCDFTVPAIVDRSPVIVAIGSGGTSASLAKALRARIEAMLPAGLGVVAARLRELRAVVNDRLRTAAQRRTFWDSLLAPGGALDPLHDVEDPAAAVTAFLEGAPTGTASVYRIVLGSSDPDELTLRQARLMAQADAVVVEGHVPAAIIDRVRRDARRVSRPADGDGLVVVLVGEGA